MRFMAKEQEIGAYSAYAIAVKHGYTGTEKEWIEEQERNRKASEQAASDAESAKTAAEVAQRAAENAKAGAESAKSVAADSATSARLSVSKAAQSVSDAESAKTAAGEAQKAAENAKSAAAVSASLAQESAVQAAGSAESADIAKTAAVQSAQRTAALEANVAHAEERINKTVSGAVEAVAAQETKSVQVVAAEGERVLGTIPQDYTAAVGEIDALKKSKAEIDDTAIDGDTWSSKHIADMLCPKVEKSGTLVQMDGMLGGYPLGVTVSWTPTQEGSGDPSPENVRPIQGRTEIKVERCGENLLNIKPFNTNTRRGITFEYVPEGGIHIQGTASANADSSTFPVWHLPPGKYYGLNTPTGVSASIVVRRNGSNLWLNTKGIFEILAGDITTYWYMIVANGTTLDNTIYPYIVPGTTAPTAYALYTGSINTLTLPSVIYGGEVDAEGKGQETWGCIDSYAGETLPAEWICDRAAYAAGTTPPNGAQVAYKMDKPKPFTATGGAAIPALSGTNTVLTDADSVTAAGRAAPIQTIAKLSDRIAALEAAATNITE